MEVDLRAFLDFAENMGVAPAKLRSELLPVGNQVGQQGARIAQSILSSNGSVVTGALLRSIVSRGAQWAGDTMIIEYGPTSDRPAQWVEFGRGPVFARQGGYLRFQIKGSGPYLYRKSVGPAAPRPFMRPSVAKLRPTAVKMLGDAAMRIIEGMV